MSHGPYFLACCFFTSAVPVINNLVWHFDQMEIEQLNGTKPGQDYYVHLLVGITETRHCLATLREYVLSVWHDSDQSDSWQPAQVSTIHQIDLL